MSSRKKREGKAKRANKASQSQRQVVEMDNEEYNWEYWLRGGHLSHSIRCDHGGSFDADPNSPISKMLTLFECGDEPSNIIDAMTHPECKSVWKDAEQRRTASNVVARIGTNMALWQGGTKDVRTPHNHFAKIAFMLENYQGGIYSTFSKLNSKLQDFSLVPVVDEKNFFLNRDAVKFYANKTPCHCLDSLYNRMKDAPKLGMCMSCHTLMKKSALLLCAKCKSTHYCSKQCQKNDWELHKKACVGRHCRLDVSDDDVILAVDGGGLALYLNEKKSSEHFS